MATEHFSSSAAPRSLVGVQVAGVGTALFPDRIEPAEFAAARERLMRVAERLEAAGMDQEWFEVMQAVLLFEAVRLGRVRLPGVLHA